MNRPLVLARAPGADAIDDELTVMEVEGQLAAEDEAAEGGHGGRKRTMADQGPEELERLHGRVPRHHGPPRHLDLRLVGRLDRLDPWATDLDAHGAPPGVLCFPKQLLLKT